MVFPIITKPDKNRVVIIILKICNEVCIIHILFLPFTGYLLILPGY